MDKDFKKGPMADFELPPEPFSKIFGLDRGETVDRYFIDSFIRDHADDIKGNVLELADSSYTDKYGTGKVTKSDVLHKLPDQPNATIAGDLETGEGIPENRFDCIVLTQVLNVIYETRAVIRNLYNSLKPGGVILATVPGITQISRYDMERWGDYWRFTTLSIRRLFEEVFQSENMIVNAFGNVYTSSAFLYGLSVEDLSREQFNKHDPDYEMLITVRAVK